MNDIMLKVFAFAVVMTSTFAFGQTNDLAELLMDANEARFAEIFAKFEKQVEKGLPILIGEIGRKLPPDAKYVAKDALARRQANAAVALLRLNQSSKVWPLLKHSPDPTVRSYLLHRLGPLGANAKTIITQLNDEPDVTIRRALILSLGEFGDNQIPPVNRNALVPQLKEMYRNDSDPGIHSAAEWLLRRWKQEDWLQQVNEEWTKDKQHRENRLAGIQQLLLNDKQKISPKWYVNCQGQTLVVIPGPVEFVMGSPNREFGSNDNEPHKKRIEQSFAIASKEITVEQFLRFQQHRFDIEAHFSTDEIPMKASWFEAAGYCNWLSEQESIPKEEWCYEPNNDGKYENGMKMASDHVQRAGYRLPTEAEWEFACRAGADTEYSFGESDELLRNYGWFWTNSSSQRHPVGLLKPTDLGLFDMHGNLWEWCQDTYRPYSPVVKAIPEIEIRTIILDNNDRRVLRGGSCLALSFLARSAYRSLNVPTTHFGDVGFRLARTLRRTSE